jgi:uncharacterized protein YndB with AHSA1/START domain
MRNEHREQQNRRFISGGSHVNHCRRGVDFIFAIPGCARSFRCAARPEPILIVSIKAPHRFQNTEPSMSETVTVISLILALAVAAVLILAARKPDSFSLRREIDIKAAPEAIFPLINDFRQWGSWSPWENKDPAMRRSFSGATSGKGSVYGWEGNKNVGSGRMEILDSATPRKIVIKLDFIKPFEGHNVAEFTLLPRGEATHVDWLMSGPTPFIGKIMHVFINMDAMIGKEFAIGLNNLKRLTES